MRARKNLGERGWLMGGNFKAPAGTVGVVTDVGFFGGAEVRFDTGHTIKVRSADIEITSPTRGWFG